MSTIVTRAGKGSPLTHTEVDNNFTNLNTDKAEDSSVVKLTGDQTIAGTKTFSSTITGSISGNAGTATNGVVTTGSYADPSWITSLDDGKVLPSMSGNTGKFLTTDGTNSSWSAVEALPSQTGNTGKYLTTDGSTASWDALATVANSGSYNDLSDKPTIPTNLDSLTDVTITTPSTDQVLKYNGTSWVNGASGGGFASGTRMIFAQTSAPTGWTKDTVNYNNHSLRVVTGTAATGGTVDFTTAFASQTPSGSVSINTSGLSAGATTLAESQIPSHRHNSGQRANNFGGSDFFVLGNGAGGGAGVNTTFTGGGGSHSHSISGSATGSFSGNAINLAVKYLDVITATKD